MSDLEFKLKNSNIKFSTFASIKDAFDEIKEKEGSDVKISLEICAYHSSFPGRESDRLEFYTLNWNTFKNNIEVNHPIIFNEYYSLPFLEEKNGKYYFYGDDRSSEFFRMYLGNDYLLNEFSFKLNDLFECTKKNYSIIKNTNVNTTTDT